MNTKLGLLVLLLTGASTYASGCGDEIPDDAAPRGEAPSDMGGASADDDAPGDSQVDDEAYDDDAPGPGTQTEPSPDGSQPPSGGGSDGGVIPTEPPKDGEKFGDWTYHQVDGALCRDGSPAGYYIRNGSDKSKNLMIFLNGGGVCYDDFFCSINPPDVNSSLPGETLLAATLDIVTGALLPIRQEPIDVGIFQQDPRNPVGDWNMVYVPYCTGDVYGGTKRDAPVPRGLLQPPQQFVGYHNVGLFLEHFGPAFKGSSDKVLLTGSSAGGFGTLLNFDRVQDYFGDDTTVYAVTDSGIPFRDAYLEPCLQKEWRDLWGLDAALPKDCKGCFAADGGGLAEGLGTFIFREKYKHRKVIGGGLSSDQDEVIKLFFSAGLNECTTSPALETVPAALGLGSYPVERYPAGLRDFIDNVAGREQTASYFLQSTLHQHLFRERFYDVNGVGMTIADWLAKILNDETTHVGGL